MKRFYVGLFAVLLSVHAASAQSLQRSAASPDKDKASVMRTGRLPRASCPRLYGVTGFTAPSGGRPVKAAAMPQEMITQQPEGTLHKDMYRNSGGYWSFFGNYMFENTFGFTQDVVVNDGGDVYVKDPFSLFVTGTWMKGTDGGDGKVTFSLPQKIYEETDPSTGKKYSYYVQKLVEVTMTDEYGYEYIGYEVDGSDNSVTFEYENDTIRKTGMPCWGLPTRTAAGWATVTRRLRFSGWVRHPSCRQTLTPPRHTRWSIPCQTRRPASVS